MSLKLKALSLCTLAATAISAVAVMNASATVQGHFTNDAPGGHALIGGVEGGSHRHHLTLHGFSGETGCEGASYFGTITAATQTSLTLAPSYVDCYTTGDPSVTVPITVNGCTYTFTFTGGNQATTEQTMHIVCPAGQKIEIHHPNCTTTIHPQTIATGLTYTTITDATKHAITLDTNIQFNIERHNLCGIFGTSGKGTLKGSNTLLGTNTAGERINITTT